MEIKDNSLLVVLWSDFKRRVSGPVETRLSRWWNARRARRRAGQALRRGLGAANGPSGHLWRTPGELGQVIAGPTLASMVWVPDGEFLMGDDKPGGGPTQKVCISNGFWLMKCLVTNTQYAQYLNKLIESGHNRARIDPVVMCEPSDIVLESGHYRTLEDRDKYPVVGATWQAAHDYAEYYGLRLPTEAEWEWAARGPERRIYPWGDCWDATRCCCSENQGRAWHWERKQYVEEGDSWDETEVTYTSPVGSFPDSASWRGALGMAGNLMEWCEDWFGDYPDSEATVQDPRGRLQGEGRVVRGGNCFYGEDECRTTNREHHPPPKYSNNSVGFRCVYTPKPESVNRHRPGH